MKWHRNLKYLAWSIPVLLLVTIIIHQSVRTEQTTVIDSSESNNPSGQEIPINQENMVQPESPIEVETPTPEVISPETPPQQPTIGKTPKELGENYIPMVQKAKESVSSLEPTMQVKFPLGVSYPILINPEIEKQETASANPNNRNTNPLSENQLEIVGVLNSSGQVKPITPSDLLEMFEFHLRGLNADNLSSAIQNKAIPVINAQNSNAQDQNVMVFDIIVIDEGTQKFSLVPNVVVIAVLRDALNAALNNTITPNNYNVSQLKLDFNQPTQSPLPSL